MTVSNSINKTLKAAFSLSFLLLFIHRISSYQEGLIKYAMLPIVAENNLVYTYYLFGFIEILAAVLVFFLPLKFAKVGLDIALLLYVPWLIVYYLLLYKSANGCIECNYTTHFLGENILVTAFVLLGLSAIYLFILRDRHPTQQTSE